MTSNSDYFFSASLIIASLLSIKAAKSVPFKPISFLKSINLVMSSIFQSQSRSAYTIQYHQLDPAGIAIVRFIFMGIIVDLVEAIVNG